MSKCCNQDCEQGRRCPARQPEPCPMAAFYDQHKAFFDELAPLPDAVDESKVSFPALPKTTEEKYSGLLLFSVPLALAVLAAVYLSGCAQ